MAGSRQFNQSLRQWIEAFMHRSIRDRLRFARDHGLSMGQMAVLMRLHHDGACGVSDVGAQLGVTSAAASQMIDRLAQSGLLERAEDPHDRRAKQLTLTAAGEALLKQGQEARDLWIDQLAAALDPQRRAAVITALGYLTQAAQELDGETSGRQARHAMARLD